MSTKQVSIHRSEPEIKKIEMIDGGRKGIKVTYHCSQSRNGVKSGIELTETQQRPVQKELKVLFSELVEHLLKCTKVYWANDTVKAMLMDGVSVNGVVITAKDQFLLMGKKKALDGYTATNTPLIKDDNYDGYNAVSDIIKKTINEARAFLTGQKGATSKETVINYLINVKGNLNAEYDYASMSKEEIETFLKEANEEYGLETVEENGETVIGFKDVTVEIEEKEETLEAEETPLFEPDDTDTLTLLEETSGDEDEDKLGQFMKEPTATKKKTKA